MIALGWFPTFGCWFAMMRLAYRQAPIETIDINRRLRSLRRRPLVSPMSRKFERRLAALEPRLKASAPEIMEIVVRGGLGPGVVPIAIFSGRLWDAAPGEPPEAFRARAKAAAEAERTPFIVFGWLPNVSQAPANSDSP
jgi:hypothetical protein